MYSEIGGNNRKSVLDLNHSDLTPGMKQYQEVKKKHPDCLVMLRMGDFYEMFYEDAVTAARELEITLTARGKGDKRAPLAGVPFHALETYLSRLVKKGFKVAIVEQLEDPKLAKGLVKRGLVRIVTPGTVIESALLEEKENNYLMCLTTLPVTGGDGGYALAFSDLSTGEFFTFKVGSAGEMLSEMVRYGPKECLVPESLLIDKELIEKIEQRGGFVNTLDDYHFREENAGELIREHFGLSSLESLGLSGKMISVSGGLLRYLLDTQKNSLKHLKKVVVKSSHQTMLIDASTFRNLELMRNIKDGTARGSLLLVIDKTVTALGSRSLKQWLKNPLLSPEVIGRRQEAVAELVNEVILLEQIREELSAVQDLERLIGRVNYGNCTPRDLLSLGSSLEKIPSLKSHLVNLKSGLLGQLGEMPLLKEVSSLISSAIRDDPPITLREGGIIKEGFNLELDELRGIMQNSKKYIKELEEKERVRTGINGLRIGYNRVFGYYIEVSRKAGAVPEDYIRKQTTANSERYITEELKNEEERILNAEEKSYQLEYELFQKVVGEIAKKTAEVQEAAGLVAVLDVLGSLALVARENRYVRPRIVEENVLQIRNGRHPVVEQLEKKFISNDVILNAGEMMIITGPNMAGKSTVLRQTALIVLLAQIGSFVPAEECVLGIVDRIFTRVGAYDDLSSGQSTFMVEMQETASILNNATFHSLIIMDEIGRGTSTFDGVSLAWSVAEHIHNNVKAKCLFATHYHVLNKLADKFERVKNYNVAVREIKGEVVFLRKLVSGGTDQSYGVQVARSAGLPYSVIERALEIQSMLEKDDEMMRRLSARKLEEQKSLGEF
jgi:DNA mismatch repair protein MutS